jgi:hypothetical protein
VSYERDGNLNDGPGEDRVFLNWSIAHRAERERGERDDGAQLYQYQHGEHVCYGVGSKGEIVKEILGDMNLKRLTQIDVTKLAMDIVVNSATTNKEDSC